MVKGGGRAAALKVRVGAQIPDDSPQRLKPRRCVWCGTAEAVPCRNRKKRWKQIPRCASG